MKCLYTFVSNAILFILYLKQSGHWTYISWLRRCQIVWQDKMIVKPWVVKTLINHFLLSSIRNMGFHQLSPLLMDTFESESGSLASGHSTSGPSAFPVPVTVPAVIPEPEPEPALLCPLLIPPADILLSVCLLLPLQIHYQTMSILRVNIRKNQSLSKGVFPGVRRFG